MPLPLLPIAVFGLIGTAAVVRRKRRAMNTSPEALAEAKVLYETLLNEVKDSDKLRTMANEFEKAGHEAEAKMLRLRADLRDAPKEVRDERKATFKKAMRSKNKVAILEVAAEFEKIGASSSAFDLREYAAHLPDDMVETPPVNSTIEESAK